MSVYIAELIGTALLLYLGESVVANVSLARTKGNGAGLIVIALGWAFAVIIPALIFTPISGAHFNPVFTIAFAAIGSFEWALVPGYILSQLVGAIIGACLMFIHYKDHFDATDDSEIKLAVFVTTPAIRNSPRNFMSEALASFVLIFVVLGMDNTPFADGLRTFGVGGLIFVIGVCLGGTTGYAINPCRDLGPRIAYSFLPIKGKRDPDWRYGWIPVTAPFIGGLCGAFFAGVIF